MPKTIKKEISIANFNCTFDTNDKPMLEYFGDIIYPAFTSNIKRKVGENTYFFHNVRVIEYKKNEFVLAGNFIKTTNLEVKNHYDDEKGLVSANEIHPSAPYSIFVIFLKNHRMIYFKNQKGSPLLTAFAGTAKNLIKQYLNIVNKDREPDKCLPPASIKIVPIPSEQTIMERLRMMEKIKLVKFRLFPTNGDIGISETFDNLKAEIFALDTKTANVQISTPKNHAALANFIANTLGTIEPTVNAVDSTGNKVVLKPMSFTEKISIEVNDNNTSIENTDAIVNVAASHTAIKLTSQDNTALYTQKLDIIKSKTE